MIRSARCALALVLFVGVAGCGKPKISEADHKRLEAAMAEADAKVTQMMEARTTGLSEALQHPAKTAGPCTRPLPPANVLVQTPGGPPPQALASFNATSHFTLLPRWALGEGSQPALGGEQEAGWARRGEQGANHGQYSRVRTLIQEILDRGTLSAGDSIDSELERIASLTSPEMWGWELVVVTDRVKTPRQVNDERFEPGEITGRALLWSYTDAAVVCAGDVEATNQDEIRSIKGAAQFKTLRNGFLEGDLEAQAFSVAVTKLASVAAGG